MSEGEVRAIDPGDYFFSYGPIKIYKEGFAEDDAVTWEAESDDWVVSAGIGAEMTAVKQMNRIVTVTLRLDEGAIANSLLSARRLAALAGTVPPADNLLFKGSGSTVIQGPKFILLGPPKGRKASATKQPVEWRFAGVPTVYIEGSVSAL